MAQHVWMVQQDTVEPGGLLELSAGISLPMPRGIRGKMGKGSRVPVHVEGLQARLHVVNAGGCEKRCLSQEACSFH